MSFPREPLLPTTTKLQHKGPIITFIQLLSILLVVGGVFTFMFFGESRQVQLVKEHPHLPNQESGGSVEETPNERVELHQAVPQRLEGLYAMNATNIDGEVQQLSMYAGQVAIVVNVASLCGFTATNYKGLENLYQKYKSSGFVVLAFPCNQFGSQEPKDNDDIKAFATSMYSVTFPMFAKVDVNGPNTHPVYSFLKNHLPEKPGGGTGGDAEFPLQWNFQKFLVDRRGFPKKLFHQKFEEHELETEILSLLSTVPDPAVIKTINAL